MYIGVNIGLDFARVQAHVSKGRARLRNVNMWSVVTLYR